MQARKHAARGSGQRRRSRVGAGEVVLGAGVAVAVCGVGVGALAVGITTKGVVEDVAGAVDVRWA